MYSRAAQHSALRPAIALVVGFALLPIPFTSIHPLQIVQGQSERSGEWAIRDQTSQRVSYQTLMTCSMSRSWNVSRTRRSTRQSAHRRLKVSPGTAGASVIQICRETWIKPSTILSAGACVNRTRRAHAGRLFNSPPPVPDNQFVQNFFTWALVRNPNSAETTYWHDQLRVAYGQGQSSLKLAAIEFGRTLFESAEYTARNREAHWYVYDLYKTYLMREPDTGGWTTWENLVPTHGREYVRRGFEESSEFSTLLTTLTPNGSPTANAASLITARVDPRNQPGHGMLARDANWSVPLLSLPGRAGLDLGLALSYSSQVWTRSGPYIYFDEDNGFPSPGFRLGFPTVEKKVFDAQTARNAYLFITGGRRVELRQVGATNLYDDADSSYLRLTDNGATLLVHSTDGTKMSFTETNGEFSLR